MERVKLDTDRLMGVRICADACRDELAGEDSVKQLALSSSRLGMKEGPTPTKQGC